MLIALALLWSAQGFYQPGKLREADIVSFAISETEAGPEWRTEGGGLLHHFAVGKGYPVIVVHGGPGHPFAAPWRALEPLTNNHRFYYYHQRGCGLSDRPVNMPSGEGTFERMETVERELGLSVHIADLERVRRAVVADPEQKVAIIGHSFGGFLAALYAAEFTEHVAALVLVAPADLLVLPTSEPDLFEIVRMNFPPRERE
jgi:proline iminopeptidase